MFLTIDYIYQKIKHKINGHIPEYNIKSLIMLSPMAVNLYKKKDKIDLRENLSKYELKIIEKAHKFYSLFYKVYQLKKTDKFPMHPVDPQELSTRVEKQLILYKTIVPIKNQQLVMELCKTFNQCIELNKKNESINLVVSPQTGSSKTLAAKMYVSLLKNESSIIVVPRVSDAISIAKDVNKWSGNRKYCRCHYLVNKDNPKSPLHILKEELQKYRSIVITHSMFKYINQANEKESNHFQLYNQKNRDLTIIDERIYLHNSYKATLFEVENLLQFILELHNFLKGLGELKELKYFIEATKEISNVLSSIKKYVFDDFEEYKLYISYESTDGYSIDEETIVNIQQKLKKAHTLFKRLKEPIIGNKLFKKEDTAKWKKSLMILESLRKIFKNGFMYLKQGNNKYLSTVENIENKFGSSVTLDATAKINMYYQIKASYGSKKTQLIETTNPKIYTNATIHLKKGQYQSRSAIFKNSNHTEIAEKYLTLVNDIIRGTKEKILVVTYKKFKDILEGFNNNPHILFTNWGNHTGKNEWNKCENIIIIGWQFYQDIDYYSNFLSAASSVENAGDEHYKRTLIKRKFKITQVADDLIQATNRINIRNVIDNNGNCPKCNIYLFYADADEYNEIIDIFITQFPGAVLDYKCKDILTLLPNKSKKYLKIDTIVEYIYDKLSKETDFSFILPQAEILRELQIPRSTASRIFNSNYFKEKLKMHCIEHNFYNGKSKGFSFIKK